MPGGTSPRFSTFGAPHATTSAIGCLLGPQLLVECLEPLCGSRRGVRLLGLPIVTFSSPLCARPPNICEEWPVLLHTQGPGNTGRTPPTWPTLRHQIRASAPTQMRMQHTGPMNSMLSGWRIAVALGTRRVTLIYLNAPGRWRRRRNIQHASLGTAVRRIGLSRHTLLQRVFGRPSRPHPTMLGDRQAMASSHGVVVQSVGILNAVCHDIDARLLPKAKRATGIQTFATELHSADKATPKCLERSRNTAGGTRGTSGEPDACMFGSRKSFQCAELIMMIRSPESKNAQSGLFHIALRHEIVQEPTIR